MEFQLLLLIKYLHLSNKIHCVKRIQIRRFYLVCIFPYSVQIRPEKRLNKKERYKEEDKMKKNCFWKLWRNCVRLLQKKKKNWAYTILSYFVCIGRRIIWMGCSSLYRKFPKIYIVPWILLLKLLLFDRADVKYLSQWIKNFFKTLNFNKVFRAISYLVFCWNYNNFCRKYSSLNFSWMIHKKIKRYTPRFNFDEVINFMMTPSLF